MFYKMVLLSILVCLTSLGVPISLVAQNPSAKQDKRTANVKSTVKQLSPGEKVVVKLNNDPSYSGTVTKTEDDDFVLLDGGGTAKTIKYADVNSVGGKHSGGPKIGLVIAIAAVAAAAVIFGIFKATGKRL